MSDLSHERLADASKSLVRGLANNWKALHRHKRVGGADAVKSLTPEDQAVLLKGMQNVGTFLHLAFSAPDEDSKDWWLFKARDRFHALGRTSEALGDFDFGGKLPESVRIEAASIFDLDYAIRYVVKHLSKRMAKCANPDCDAPCFFRSERRGRQPYCVVGGKCAKASRKRNKRKWWKDTGSAKRRAKSPGRKSGVRGGIADRL